MRRIICIGIWIAAIALPVLADRPPNVLLLYAEDLGYGDVSCYNPDRGKISTPHIDRLAAEGMRFTDAHSSSGVCSPSRYTLLTGRYHWRSRLQRGIVGLWEKSLIAPDRLTLGGMLSENGYRTAMVGKWHLGWDWPIPQGGRVLLDGSKKADNPATDAQITIWRELFSQPIPGGPLDRGFDRYFGTDVPNWPPFCFIEDRRTVGIPSEFLPVRLFNNHMASLQGPALAGWTLEPILPALVDRTCEWIGGFAREKQPFFLFMALTSPHTPLAVNDAWKGKSGLGPYADFVMETDAMIGRVLAALEASGAADETLVILTSDNGCAPYIGVVEMEKKGHFSSGPLRGYKSDAWEGGHRVPFIVRWPGKVAAGSRCDQLVHQADIFATLAAAAGHDLPPDAAEDSVNLLPLLENPARPVREHAVSQSAQGMPALRQGAWKLIFGKGSGGWSKGGDDQPGQLYHLADDPGETRNLYAGQPDRVAAMTELMQSLVENGRSTPGPRQQNDVPVQWRRFYQPTKTR